MHFSFHPRSRRLHRIKVTVALMHQFNPTHVIGCDKSLFSITHQGILVALQFRYECNSLVFCNCKERKRERERNTRTEFSFLFFYFAHKLSGKKFGCVGATSYPRREKKERKKEERERKKARSMIFEKVGELE